MTLLMFLWMYMHDQAGREIKTAIAFKSSKFPPEPDELKGIENGDYLVGLSLAQYITIKLSGRGYEIAPLSKKIGDGLFK